MSHNNLSISCSDIVEKNRRPCNENRFFAGSPSHLGLTLESRFFADLPRTYVLLGELILCRSPSQVRLTVPFWVYMYMLNPNTDPISTSCFKQLGPILPVPCSSLLNLCDLSLFHHMAKHWFTKILKIITVYL